MQFLRRFRRTPSAPTLNSIEAYTRWAANYPPHAHNALMQTEQQTMLALLPEVSGKIILDLACGTGRYALQALERGAKQTIGLDNSMAMLQANPSEQRALSTSEALPLPSACIDGVLCGLALGHLPRLQPSLQEIARVLKKDGWTLISDFHPFMFLSGARRTFTAPDGKTYAVEHYPHLYADYHQAAAKSGLTIDKISEPRLNDTDGDQPPVVIVYRLRKL